MLVCVVWTLPRLATPIASDADEVVPSKFGWHRLDDALSKGWSFPSPRFHTVLPLRAEELRPMLEEKAEWEYRRTGCACGYLGYLVRGDAATGHFEPDPSMWPLAALQGAGGELSKMFVWYEWKYVTIGPEKKPHRVRQRVDHAVGKRQQQWMTPRLDTDRVFGFSNEHGEYARTAQEVLKDLRGMELNGIPKYAAARSVCDWFKQGFPFDAHKWGDTPEKQETGQAYTRELIMELEAIASMMTVDGLVDFPEGFVDLFRRAPPGHDLGLEVDGIREPLRKFLSTSTPHDSKLRDCYVAVDAALEMFQRTWTTNLANAMGELVRSMNQINKGVSQPSPKQARGPHPSTFCSPLFAAGTVVIFQNLIKRLDLEDQVGTVESYDVRTTRYAVRIHSSGERARVLERCLRNAQSVVPVVDMT